MSEYINCVSTEQQHLQNTKNAAFYVGNFKLFNVKYYLHSYSKPCTVDRKMTEDYNVAKAKSNCCKQY